MNIQTVILKVLCVVALTVGFGCGKIIDPVDTYGFNQAFEEKVEPTKGSPAIGKESIQLARDILKAVSSHDLEMALTKLESLRLQNDLSPRQRLETKSLHTAVVDYLNESQPTQNAGKDSSTPAG